MKRYVIMIVCVLVVCAIWTGGWLFIASKIEAEYTTIVAQSALSETKVSCGEFNVTGYPFSFAPQCLDAKIVTGDLKLEAPEVIATALFYKPNHIQLLARSPLKVTDEFNGGVKTIEWSNLHGSVRVDGDKIARISILSDDLVYSDALFADAELASAKRAEFHLLDAGEPEVALSPSQNLDFFTMLEGVEATGFDIANGGAAIDGRIHALPTLSMLSHPDVLRFWQQNGGKVELRGANIIADGVESTAVGEVTLDVLGRVNGNVTMTSKGIVERFGALKDDPMAALFLGTPDDEGKYSQTLRLVDGVGYIGMIPLMQTVPLF